MEQNHINILNEIFSEMDKIKNMYKILKRNTKMLKKDRDILLDKLLENIIERQTKMFDIMLTQQFLTNDDIQIIKNDFDKIIEIKQNKQINYDEHTIKCFKYLRMSDDLSNFINNRISAT